MSWLETPKAYTEALVEVSPLGELSELGSTLHFTVHDQFLIECVIKVAGTRAIPSEVKQMSKVRYHELYQDHICSCVLRVAREVFALLPVETVLITALVDGTDARTGHAQEQAVLSTAITRAILGRLDFEHLDPSQAMENFLYRCDFRSSRTVGAFAPINPLNPSDLARRSIGVCAEEDLLTQVERMHQDMKAEAVRLRPAARAS